MPDENFHLHYHKQHCRRNLCFARTDLVPTFFAHTHNPDLGEMPNNLVPSHGLILNIPESRSSRFVEFTCMRPVLIEAMRPSCEIKVTCICNEKPKPHRQLFDNLCSAYNKMFGGF
nr:12.5 kDa-like protein [Bovine adenovirus 10]